MHRFPPPEDAIHLFIVLAKGERRGCGIGRLEAASPFQNWDLQPQQHRMGDCTIRGISGGFRTSQHQPRVPIARAGILAAQGGTECLDHGEIAQGIELSGDAQDHRA